MMSYSCSMSLSSELDDRCSSSSLSSLLVSSLRMKSFFITGAFFLSFDVFVSAIAFLSGVLVMIHVLPGFLPLLVSFLDDAFGKGNMSAGDTVIFMFVVCYLMTLSSTQKQSLDLMMM